MTNTPEDDVLTDELAQISARYRMTATETSPEWLDNAVLRSATAQVRPSGFVQRLSSWVRPIAFATTAGLCLALILEFGQVSGIGDSTATGDYADSAADALSSAVEASGRRLQDLNRTADSIKPSNSARYCTERQSADANDWWRCIEELQSAGRTTSAQAELDLLKSRFPEFEPPE